MLKQVKNNQLAQAFLEHQSVSEMSDFLDGILTPKEKFELARRLQIVELIKSGMPHQAIAKMLGVGVATVTRGSREVQLGRFKYV
jgi:TrpR family transcriptional regulator, trp operon repressor